jgi:nucleoside-diphosphate-sugar epimerase
VVLRPAIIYGPGDRLTWPRIERALRRRVLPLPDGGKRILDLVYVSDVVEALLAAASRPEAVGHAYNITDGEIHSYRDILLAYEQASGRRPRILPIPSKALMGTLQRLFRMMQTLRVPGNWERQSGRLRGLNLDIHYAIDAARRDLAYVPRVGLQEGVRRTMAWYTDHQPAGSGA